MYLICKEIDFIYGCLSLGRRPPPQKHGSGGHGVQAQVGGPECHHHPLVFTNHHCYHGSMKYVCDSRTDYNLVANWSAEAWRRQGAAVTRDSRSRMDGTDIILPKVPTIEVSSEVKTNFFMTT